MCCPIGINRVLHHLLHLLFLFLLLFLLLFLNNINEINNICFMFYPVLVVQVLGVAGGVPVPGPDPVLRENRGTRRDGERAKNTAVHWFCGMAVETVLILRSMILIVV